MSDIVIRVENLSKKYTLSHHSTDSYTTIRDQVTGSFKSLGEWFIQSSSRRSKSASREFWALKDVSFEVKQGDRLGIIGLNGAGKSTLLKIISRITPPTKGQITIYGKVASLLEVGTGFHPELTGRENIFLNGALVGMTKAEMTRKFDEIVDFAEVEQFLDVPVKRYSSGMYVRLAFAVAAHLDSEILIIDEVLAVGDTAFQRKCLDKMRVVSTQGRTIIFVSHNTGTLQSLCQRGILLKDKTVVLDAQLDEVVREYMRMIEQFSSQSLLEREDRRGHGATRLSQVQLFSHGDVKTNTLITGQPAKFVFHVTRSLPNLSCKFVIYNHLGQPVTYLNSSVVSAEDLYVEDFEGVLTCCIDELLLVPGRYRISVGIWSEDQIEDYLDAALVFNVEPGPVRDRYFYSNPIGSIVHPHRWIVPHRSHELAKPKDEV